MAAKHKFNIAEVEALIVSGPLPPPPQSAEGSYAPAIRGMAELQRPRN
jgi:hypothetical protein